MNKSFDFFCGIDPSWTGKKPTAVSVLDRELRLVEFVYTRELKKIVEPLTRYSNIIVGIDASLIVVNETGHRPNEREFLNYFAKFGLSLYPVNKKRYPFFFPELLYKRLGELGYRFELGNIFEVYPQATIAVLFNEMMPLHYKRIKKEERLGKLYWLEEKLRSFVEVPASFVVPRDEIKVYEDFLDSLVCALTVALSNERTCMTFGSEELGIMLVLKPE